MSDQHWSQMMLPRERIEQLESVNRELRKENEARRTQLKETEAKGRVLMDMCRGLKARVAELESCVDDGASVWGDYLCTGGGSPVAHGKFVRAAKAFIAKAQRLRQKADEAERAGGEK